MIVHEEMPMICLPEATIPIQQQHGTVAGKSFELALLQERYISAVGCKGKAFE